MALLVFAASVAEAEAMAARVAGTIVKDREDLNAAVQCLGRGENVVIVGREVMTMGWRAPEGTVVLFTPVFALAVDDATKVQAAARAHGNQFNCWWDKPTKGKEK